MIQILIGAVSGLLVIGGLLAVFAWLSMREMDAAGEHHEDDDSD